MGSGVSLAFPLQLWLCGYAVPKDSCLPQQGLQQIAENLPLSPDWRHTTCDKATVRASAVEAARGVIAVHS